jgi:xanthine dehydrogenase large subunit
MKNSDTYFHVSGESKFTDDMTAPEDLLYAAVFPSSVAHGKIIRLNTEPAAQIQGVAAVLTAEDIPGDNQIGLVIPDEPLLAPEKVSYIGQPIAVVIAEDARTAREAAQAIEIAYEKLPAVFDAREACEKGFLIGSPRTFSMGNTDAAWQYCDIIVEGEAESGGQEHFYLEPQNAIAFPAEHEGIKIISATQSPGDVQRMTARVLGLPMHKIEVEAQRLGGAFGGKEVQATPWAVVAAMAASRFKRPVKFVLRRDEDIRMTGKRHPYSSDFKIGLTRDGNILAYEVTFYQNAGASADLSISILGRSFFHASNSYFIPNVRITGFCCRTNLPPNTACRGFGSPQAVFVIESAIFKASEKMGVSPGFIQKKNLLKIGDEFPFGMRVENTQAQRCWQKAEKQYKTEDRLREIQNFNQSHKFQKKGMSLTPICFGVSYCIDFFLNQAAASVQIYTDGSVSVSIGAVEMGQGVHEKIRQVPAEIFSIPLNRIKVESTNTSRIANMSPTSASLAADLNGNAVRLACLKLLDRISGFAAEKLGIKEKEELHFNNEIIWVKDRPTDLKWARIIGEMYMNRISLSERAHYSIPGLYFDEAAQKGRPFAYHVFGTAVTEAAVDCLRGTYQIDSVRIVHDFGKSLNPLIDRGQVEGGLVQGIGWMTTEELVYAEKGTLLTDTPLTYKIPDIRSAPREIQVDFLENSDNPLGIFNSKAVGEPPLLYGIGAYFAVLQAMKAFRPELRCEFSAPLSSEKVLMWLYGGLN